jgi:hypothetical protein
MSEADARTPVPLFSAGRLYHEHNSRLIMHRRSVKSLSTPGVNRFMQTRLKGLAVVLAMLSLSTTAAGGQDGVARAKDLYNAAYYEDALDLLNGLMGDVSSPVERQGVQEYRALCFLALDRPEEADKAVAEMIDADPFYSPNPEQLPPRFLSAFERVRRDHLPTLIRERYATARTEFGQRQFTPALKSLELVVTLIELVPPAPDGRAADEQSDLLGIQTGARELIQRIRADRDQPPGEHIYSSNDSGVVAPAPIRAEIPVWRPAVGDGRSFQGELELVIDRSGNVQSAKLVTPISPAYDAVLLDAAKQWTFRAATKDTQPVPYRTRLTISLTPQRKKP